MIPHASPFARSTISAAALAAFALLFAGTASAQTPVMFGDTITDPGFYFLAGNQTGNGTGIVIDSDDVVLFLARFTLRGSGIKGGVVCDGHDNVLVYGGRVTNFDTGIVFFDGHHCTVKDVRVDHCVGDGLFVDGNRDSFFARLRCDCNGLNGVEALAVDDCRFLSILAHDNGRNGILLNATIVPVEEEVGDTTPYPERNKIKLCWAAYNGLDGIRLDDADTNEIERNECVNNDGAGIGLRSVLTDSGLGGQPRSNDNFLRSNWCVFNGEGIAVEWGSSDNTLTNNTALANFHRDMVDENYEMPCANTWFLNFFLTKGGDGEDCIF